MGLWFAVVGALAGAGLAPGVCAAADGLGPVQGWYEVTAAKDLGPAWSVEHEQEWRARTLDARPARWHAETILSRTWAVGEQDDAAGRSAVALDAVHRATRYTATPSDDRWRQRGALGAHGRWRKGATRADLRWRAQLDADPGAGHSWLTRVRARLRQRLGTRWQVGAFAEGWQGLSGFGGRWQRLRVAALATVGAGPLTFGVSHALQLETGDGAWAQLLRVACHIDVDKLLGGTHG